MSDTRRPQDDETADKYGEGDGARENGELIPAPTWRIQKGVADTRDAIAANIPMGPEPKPLPLAPIMEDDDGKGPFGNGEFDQAMSAERDDKGNLVP